MGGVRGANLVCDWPGTIGINNNYFTSTFHSVLFQSDNITVLSIITAGEKNIQIASGRKVLSRDTRYFSQQ